MSDWSSGLCGCFENVGICIKAYFCPCIVAGQIGEALGEGCCYHGFCSLMGPIGIYCGAQNRVKLREKYQIPVSQSLFFALFLQNFIETTPARLTLVYNLPFLERRKYEIIITSALLWCFYNCQALYNIIIHARPVFPL